MYINKIDLLFKSLLKHYSVKLQDTGKQVSGETIEVYKKIFSTLEDYIRDILPIKLKIENKEKYSEVIAGYEQYESFSVGKLDEKYFLVKI